MPPSSGRKRRANGAFIDTDGAESPTLPCRETWPGWVEMESEPALFNVMLKEMGVRDVKVQEVYGMDEDMLATLPQPVHALIFLFRYRDVDKADEECPDGHDQIWFANQIPEFACATVALLNIVNNIPDLAMGVELRQFKDFTATMDPISRGEAIDSFQFVRRIHNSFARENDLLTADVHSKNKLEKARRKVAADKARATRVARKNLRTFREDAPPSGASPVRSSARQARSTVRASTPPPTTPPPTTPSPTLKKAPSQPSNGAPGSSGSSLSSPDSESIERMVPPKAEDSPETGDRIAVRRSTRDRKLVIKVYKPENFEDSDASGDGSGFHFVAYMPIGGRVWKMDGLDTFPHDLGAVEDNTGTQVGSMDAWIRLAQPAIMGRMAQFEGADIQYNVMAVVQDPAVKDREHLVQNVKALQIVDAKLSGIAEDWAEMEGAETRRDVITSISPELGIQQSDIDSAAVDTSIKTNVAGEEDLLKLIEIRKDVISRQASLRGGVRDALTGSKEDDEKARHRRHDYSSFVRGWLGALAEEQQLSELVDDE